MYEKYMLVKGKHFEINRITNFHSTSSELYFEKSSNMTKTIWQKWVITFFYEIHSAHLIYPRVKLTCAGKYVERVKSHSWALGAGLNCRAGKLEGRVNTPRIRYTKWHFNQQQSFKGPGGLCWLWKLLTVLFFVIYTLLFPKIVAFLLVIFTNNMQKAN